MTSSKVTYYQFDCMNSYVAGLYKAEEFSSEEEAIEKASDYEATLVKHIYENGERVASTLLYDPREHA